MSDDNDFMGSSFSNYETTEHKMLSDNEVGSGDSSGTGGHPKQVFTVAGKETSTGKMIGGFVVLVIGIVIGVSVAGEKETAMECFGGAAVIIAAIAGAFAIWRFHGKSDEAPRHIITSEEYLERERQFTRDHEERVCIYCGAVVDLIGDQKGNLPKFLCCRCEHSELALSETLLREKEESELDN